jgi:hypothetical protein
MMEKAAPAFAEVSAIASGPDLSFTKPFLKGPIHKCHMPSVLSAFSSSQEGSRKAKHALSVACIKGLFCSMQSPSNHHLLLLFPNLLF